MIEDRTDSFGRILPRESPGSTFMGAVDGPMVFVESLQREVPSYIDPRKDLLTGSATFKSLNYHVPLMFRGNYRPPDLRNYDPDKIYPIGAEGVARCYGHRADGKPCSRGARNLSGYCPAHGGALHPADRLYYPSDPKMKTPDLTGLNRLQLVVVGAIKISELTDEEIAVGKIRMPDGTFFEDCEKVLSARQFHELRAELFKRADKFLRENVMDMLKVMREIAINPVEEARDRIVAATWSAERVLGKTPDILLTQQIERPFDQLFGDLTGGTRVESQRMDINAGSEEAMSEYHEDYDDAPKAISARGGASDNGDSGSVLDVEVESDPNAEYRMAPPPRPPSPAQMPSRIDVSNPIANVATWPSEEAARAAMRGDGDSIEAGGEELTPRVRHDDVALVSRTAQERLELLSEGNDTTESLKTLTDPRSKPEEDANAPVGAIIEVEGDSPKLEYGIKIAESDETKPEPFDLKKAKEDRKAEMAKIRRRRYVAKANGLKTMTNEGYLIEFSPLNDDSGAFRMKLIEP